MEEFQLKPNKGMIILLSVAVGVTALCAAAFGDVYWYLLLVLSIVVLVYRSNTYHFTETGVTRCCLLHFFQRQTKWIDISQIQLQEYYFSSYIVLSKKGNCRIPHAYSLFSLYCIIHFMDLLVIPSPPHFSESEQLQSIVQRWKKIKT